MVAIYLASDPKLYRHGAAKMLPPSQHGRVLDAMDVTGSAQRLWFGGQLVTMALVGVVSGLAYSWIGLPPALVLFAIVVFGLVFGWVFFSPSRLRSRALCW